MILDSVDEISLTLREAAQLPCLRRNGRQPHLATLHRWAQRGVRGRKLQVRCVGGSLCTTREWVLAFIQRQDLAGTHDPPHSELSSRRRQAIARAEKELSRNGIG